MEPLLLLLLLHQAVVTITMITIILVTLTTIITILLIHNGITLIMSYLMTVIITTSCYQPLITSLLLPANELQFQWQIQSHSFVRLAGNLEGVQRGGQFLQDLLTPTRCSRRWIVDHGEIIGASWINHSEKTWFMDWIILVYLSLYRYVYVFDLG